MNWYEDEREIFRRRVNRQVEQLQRNNGITEHSDLSIAAAMDIIRALDPVPTRRHTRVDHTYADELIEAVAHWHQPCPLAQYKVRNRTAESRRDMGQAGVYVILEPLDGDDVPRYVEAIPRYAGEGKNLGHRLWQHSTGRSSNPADFVTEEYLDLYATEEEREAYASAFPSAQREIRELCVDRRGLWVKTTHTETKAEAQRLENAVINLYLAKGIKLWNKRLYTTHKAWRSIISS